MNLFSIQSALIYPKLESLPSVVLTHSCFDGKNVKWISWIQLQSLFYFGPVSISVMW